MHAQITEGGRVGGACRDARIEVRVTRREMDRIRSKARRSAMTVSSYVRHSALGDREAPSIEVDAVALREAHVNLKRAGSNINQIARALNTYGAGGTHTAAIDSALSSVAAAADAVAEVLSLVRGR